MQGIFTSHYTSFTSISQTFTPCGLLYFTLLYIILHLLYILLEVIHLVGLPSYWFYISLHFTQNTLPLHLTAHYTSSTLFTPCTTTSTFWIVVLLKHFTVCYTFLDQATRGLNRGVVSTLTFSFNYLTFYTFAQLLQAS